MMKPNRTTLQAGPWRCHGAVLVLAASSLSLPAFGQKIFYESFNGVPLGPNVEEASAGAAVWTKTPPAGWSIDDSQMPGFGTPEYAANDGRREWAGWSFADVKWWPTVDNQRRAEFVRASGAAAIADPDEWDDATHLKGFFNSYLKSAEIDLAGKAANSLVVAFDSSWRPEGRDDGGANWPVGENGESINNQTAIVTASFDGGAPVEIMRWDSVSDSGFYHDHNPNEGVIVSLNNPAGAQKVVLTFALVEAANDWWWAFDNLAIGEPPMVTGVTATGVGFSIRITEALGKTVNENAALTATLDGQTVTVTKTREGEEVLVGYDQSPTLFQPRSSHDVAVTFTTGDGRQVTDTASFIAPGYTTVAATPATLTATITEQTYFTVDTTKGVSLEVDGAAVTPQSVTRVDLTDANTGEDLPDQILVKYSPATPFASESVHSVKVTFTTGAAQAVSETVSATVPKYATLPTSLATATGTGTEAGMRWKTHQLEAARDNTIAATEQQLAGELGESVHDDSLEEANGYYNIEYVNMDVNGADAGRFNASSAVNSQVVGDEIVPGIPGLLGTTTYAAGEALAYLELPQPGIYTMVVNSDDGFQVSMGNAANPKFLVLGEFNAGRGQADTVFYFKVDQAGVYLFRLLYFQGTGDGRVEWFTGNADEERALINGPAGIGVAPIKAFRRRTVAEPELPPTALSIGLNFGSDEADNSNSGSLAAADVAGVPSVKQANWNNLRLATSSTNTIVGDANGTAVATSVTVEWTSANTWSTTGRSEENNGFTGTDRTLMTGYLDTGAATTSTVTISGLPASFASEGYDVYVYTLGGVAGRGGAIRATDGSGAVLKDYVRVASGANPSAYSQVIPSGTTYGEGTYVVFDDLSATSLKIEATTANGLGFSGIPRAPINAIQLVSPPSYVPAPTLSVARDGANVRVTWSAGSLESADTVTGAWTAVPGVTSPATIPASGAQKYYRARN